MSASGNLATASRLMLINFGGLAMWILWQAQ